MSVYLLVASVVTQVGECAREMSALASQRAATVLLV